jgi:hypothetical protein
VPDPAPRLPARPSLEQLRKRAKELLRRGDPRVACLADAQLILARELGFESWPRLVHHIQAIGPAGHPARYERLARDILAVGQAGDMEALARLNELFSRSFTLEDRRAQLAERIGALRGGGEPVTEFTLADAELLVARQHGFESWAHLIASLSRPPADPRTAPLGMSSTPPFYRIDWTENTLEPRPPLTDRDWDTIVRVMKELGITGLRAGGQMTDAALACVAELDQLTQLDLGGSGRLTDDGLRHLARLPRLELLDLSGWESPITDCGLEVLRHLPDLRQFKMCWSRRISDAGVANLTFCDKLEEVNLLGTPTGDGAINALTGKRQLRRLRTGRLVTDAGLPLLHRIPAFAAWPGGEVSYSLMSPDAGPTHLLLDGPFTDRGLASLAGLDGLFGLSFFWHASAMTANGLEPLAGLPSLGFLGCEGKICDDRAMRHIGALPRLRMLMAQGTVAGDDGFAALSGSPTIEYIWGRECPNLTGRGFAALAAMPALRGLAMSCKRVDDHALSALPRFPALRELMPMDVPDEGFRHVGRCGRLEALWCMYCRDTGDVATGHIAGLSQLRTYYAGKTRITDRSLAVLGRMHSLERITLWATASVTDAGIAALAGLPRLREISLEGLPRVTREGAALFAPGVRVSYSA